ncbi:MAG: AAA family ATPase [Candidatus Poribacteria bacterium]|nr:AAA family ATPase [Candidatus Poribacteria bacterium]
MPHLEHLSIHGFKSIRKLENFELRRLNILIGANGAGKSNLLSLFKMLSALSWRRLQLFVKIEGGPDALLFGGRKLTASIEVALSFGTNQYGYDFSLEPTADSVAFSAEKISTMSGTSAWSGGSGESRMISALVHKSHERDEELVFYALPHMRSWRVFHFQDMSNTARVRNQSEIRDNVRLRPDGGNLAPFLRQLREHHPNHYRRTRDVVRLATPYFKDFVYRKYQNPGDNMDLEWYEALGDHPDTVFGPRQLSDGTLRFICLATLLNQPEYLRPSLILIDEPELGLHPFALTLLAEMIQQAANLQQVIVSTQSAELVSHFEPEDIVVVDRKSKESVFRRLDSESLAGWLEDYTLGDLWKMNVLGGRP